MKYVKRETILESFALDDGRYLCHEKIEGQDSVRILSPKEWFDLVQERGLIEHYDRPTTVGFNDGHYGNVVLTSPTGDLGVHIVK